MSSGSSRTRPEASGADRPRKARRWASLGTYTLTIAGTGEFSGATGDLNIDDATTITGAGSGVTIIDGNALDRVFQSFDDNLTLNDVTVRNGNVTGLGGCLYFSNASLTLSRSVVSGCTADGSGGGIMFFTGSSDPVLTLTDTTVVANTVTGLSTGAGVSLCCSADGTGVINGSTISGNSGALFGGGIRTTASMTIANTTLSGNVATSGGGAVSKSGSTGTVTLVNVTIASNASGSSSDTAIQVFGGAVTAKNTIIASNTVGGSANCGGTFGIVTDLGHNLEFPGTSCGFGLPTDLQADPLLGTLADNGGLTLTHAIALGSPAV